MKTLLITATLALLVGAAPAAESATPTTHLVKSGESLRVVAGLYDCTLAELFLANQEVVEHPHMLGVGVKLNIPDCTSASEAADPETLDIPAAEETPLARHCGWTRDLVDTERLKERLKEAEVSVPEFFQAVVVETTATRSGEHIAEQRVLSLGPVDRPQGWHPGLTVSLLSAIGALDRASELGFTGPAEITFHDETGPVVATLEGLIDEALRQGKPFAHNRLVQLAGSDRLHRTGGVLARRGLASSQLKRAFGAAAWADQGQPRSLRRAPGLKLGQGKKAIEIPASIGTPLVDCDQEACTTVEDLARAMCLVTQHQRLPSSRRLALGEGEPPANLALLRTALQRRRRQAPGQLEGVFSHALKRSKGYSILRRADRHDGWSTLVLGVTSSSGRREYVVAMTAYGKIPPLRDAAAALARLLKAEDL